MLCFHLCLVLLHSHFLSSFPAKPCMHYSCLLSPICATCSCESHPPWFENPNNYTNNYNYNHDFKLLLWNEYCFLVLKFLLGVKTPKPNNEIIINYDAPHYAVFSLCYYFVPLGFKYYILVVSYMYFSMPDIFNTMHIQYLTKVLLQLFKLLWDIANRSSFWLFTKLVLGH